MPRTATRIDLGDVLAGLARPPADDVDAAIAAAAAELLVSGGLAAVQVEDVAARAGVGRSTLYRRHADRNAVLALAVATEARRLLRALADWSDDPDGDGSGPGDLADRVALAFVAGWRHARRSGFAEVVRAEPELLRLLTVDAGPLLAACRDVLVAEADRRVPGLDPTRAGAVAELLVRLAVSFVLTPATAVDLDDPGALRPLLAGLLA